MKIIFSPSKEMKNDRNYDDKFCCEILFPDKTDFLLQTLKKLKKEEISEIFKIKNNLLEETLYNIQNFEKNDRVPAIFMYNGVAYKELNLNYYNEKSMEYIADNVLILSAFYGVLKAFSMTKFYRLDMTINLLEKNLYSFWNEDVNIFFEKFNNETILNLASSEFSKMVKTKMINVAFYEDDGKKMKIVSSYAKQARGCMLDYVIKNCIENVEDIKKFNERGYVFREDMSDEKNYIFTRGGKGIARK